jgi:hypothetical protein
MLARTTIIIAGIIIALLSLNGCAKDRSLAPPPESQYVTVTVRVPPNFEAETMQVTYRSAVCKRRRSNSAGGFFEIDGFHNIEIRPRRIENTDRYTAKLEVDGGGQCQWRLSNTTFGVTHPDPNVYGANWVAGGGSVVVVFDNNNSGHGGVDYHVDGNLKITKDYYPWISERYLGGHSINLSLIGHDPSYLIYKAPTAREIYFEPLVHTEYVLRSVGPKVKKEGNYTKYTYPDGTVSSDGKWPPSFNRLEAIRHAAEAKK